MSRPRNTSPTVRLTACLPEYLAHHLQLHLYSELEGRVPVGAQQEFFTMLVREYFERLADAAPVQAQAPEVPKGAEDGKAAELRTPGRRLA